MVRLSPSRLHDSLRGPALGAVGFLNEVMSRYPDAISFAPGAPHPRFVDGLDVQRCVDRFLDHLVHDRGETPEQARLRLYEYGPSRGLINGLVSEALRRDEGIDAPPQALVVTVGAQEAMLLVLRALFRPEAGDVLAVTDPCFAGITGAAGVLGIPVTGVDETETGIDLEGLAAACHRARSAGRHLRACYVASDFSNPGGGRMSLADRQRLLELAEREDFLVLEDNTYGFTTERGQELPPLKALDTGGRVIHIGTFAKVCFPGARVGYVVADQPVAGRPGRLLADELAALKTVVTVNTPPLSQAVIGGLLLEHGGSLAALSRPKAELYRRNLAHLVSALDRTLTGRVAPGVSWNRPAGGFFVRMRLPVPADAALLEISAADYGVLWTPMAQFHLDDRGDHQLRLSCSYLDPDRIETGVRRLATFLDKEIGQ
ncbi:PLP-dependent aminotransferase family protein [Streptomyces albidoflavus]|uniref:aminotransferase-like domain-containing protein n=1 Tax=Streptomyces albidoflavus TaxID=1886 RepID=UPI0033B1A84E